MIKTNWTIGDIALYITDDDITTVSIVIKKEKHDEHYKTVRISMSDDPYGIHSHKSTVYEKRTIRYE